MRRVQILSSHFASAADEDDDDEQERVKLASAVTGDLPPPPPVVKATTELSTNPVKFLQSAAAVHPEIFSIDRGGHLTTVVVDPKLYDDILSDEEIFNPDFSASMPTNHNVFQISKEDLAAHEDDAIKTLKVEVRLPSEHAVSASISKLCLFEIAVFMEGEGS